MSNIYVPETKKSEEQEDSKQKLVVNYEPSEEDEQCFHLIYGMNLQPSEVGFDATDPEKRKWLLARMMMQKRAEQEMFMQQQMAQELQSKGGLKF